MALYSLMITQEGSEVLRYGIYGDIHANLEALTAVLQILERECVDQYVCTGDIVGYGANPRECIHLVQETKSLVVAGNWDCAVIGKLDLNYFHIDSQYSILWTQQQLRKKELSFLTRLDLIEENADIFTVVHSSLVSPEAFGYLETYNDMQRCCDFSQTPICFVGHSHIPVVFCKPNSILEHYSNSVIWQYSKEMSAKKSIKMLVNVGSVGQPRDNNPHACCVVYDNNVQKIWFHRIEYDVEKTIAKIYKSGMAKFFGERLRGKTDSKDCLR